LHTDMMPKGRQLVPPRDSDPIVIAVDVTGSMGDWTKIMYDKMPMFFGQIMMQGYLDQPVISFAGVGDAYSDAAPLQVGGFAEGGAIDRMVRQLFLEAGGGGQTMETYELAAYFYSRRCLLPQGKKGYFFFTGDEGFYDVVKKEHIERWVGEEEDADVNSKDVFSELRSKFHVFLLRKPFFDRDVDERLAQRWRDELGTRVLEVPNSKAIVDVMLGAIALVSGTRTLEEYGQDMVDKGQDEVRCREVLKALEGLAANPNPPSPTAARRELMAKRKSVLGGSPADVAKWIQGLGLGKDYTEEMTSNGIDGTVLRTLSESDLKEIGVASFGDRRKIKMALKALTGE